MPNPEPVERALETLDSHKCAYPAHCLICGAITTLRTHLTALTEANSRLLSEAMELDGLRAAMQALQGQLAAKEREVGQAWKMVESFKVDPTILRDTLVVAIREKNQELQAAREADTALLEALEEMDSVSAALVCPQDTHTL